MEQTASKRLGIGWGAWGAMGFLWLAAGCAGPDFIISPQYQPSRPLTAPAGITMAVRVEVNDARTTKPETRPDGREVLAAGDKGKIFLDRPATRLVEDSMTSGLKAAGFNVTSDAAVVVEVDLVDLPVEAYQFTHWNLPSERASTLDALGAVLPGPVRETRAKIALNVVIRKHDTRLGFSHVVTSAAANSSTEREVVERTLSQAIGQAVEQAVAQSAPDVEIVTRTPVTRREIDGREEELLKQQKAIKDLGDLLANREAVLAGDRTAMEEMRRTLAEDQRMATDRLAAERKALEDQRAAMAQERAALKAKLVELANKQQETSETRAALAAAQKQQAGLDARAAGLGKRGDELDVRGRLLDERENNLAAYAGKLDGEARSNHALADELAARQKDLEDHEKALEGWKRDLEARAAAKPPVEIVQKRHPLIIITDPTASHTETTLPQISISGVAIDDRGVVSLHATVNGQPIPADGMAGNERHGVGIQATPVADGAAGEQSLAARHVGFTAPLKEGINEIVVEAVNNDQLSTTQKLSVLYDKGGGRIHIITIGINDYQDRDQVPALQYAVSDAQEMAATFERVIDAPSSKSGPDVRELINGQATRANVSRMLFEELPSEVRPSDTVIVFFSGHGAPDALTDQQGNVETFLLPIDADPQHLFSTAIRMNDVGTILRRLPSERIIFIADTCYSGAATAGVQGARTISLQTVALKGGVGIKAIPNRPTGKGVAVMTAATGTQVAQEKLGFRHGVFTYFLLQGLNGAADANHDGKVTVDELYDYVRASVSSDTDGKQVPQISRDPTAGDIVLSRVTKP